MFYYVLIKDGVVMAAQESETEIEGDSPYMAVDELPAMQSIFDGEKFTAPEPEKIRIITVRAFRSRLTLAEKIAIKASQNPAVQVLDDDLKTSTFIDLDFVELQQGIDYLISEELIAPERKAELLADGTPEEAF